MPIESRHSFLCSLCIYNIYTKHSLNGFRRKPTNLKQAMPSGMKISVQHRMAPMTAHRIAHGKQNISLNASFRMPPTKWKLKPIIKKMKKNTASNVKVIIIYPPIL